MVQPGPFCINTNLLSLAGQKFFSRGSETASSSSSPLNPGIPGAADSALTKENLNLVPQNRYVESVNLNYLNVLLWCKLHVKYFQPLGVKLENV